MQFSYVGFLLILEIVGVGSQFCQAHLPINSLKLAIGVIVNNHLGDKTSINWYFQKFSKFLAFRPGETAASTIDLITIPTTHISLIPNFILSLIGGNKSSSLTQFFPPN